MMTHYPSIENQPEAKDFVDATKKAIFEIKTMPATYGWIQVVTYDVNDEIIDAFTTNEDQSFDDIKQLLENDGYVLMV